MEIIDKYFPTLTISQKSCFSQLEKLYSDWNQKVNVISRKDIGELYLKHVLHSLAIGKYIQFIPETKILDIGTGGGFPGIPLAILFPDAQFLLTDSVGKKIRVVESVCQTLRLENCRAMCIRTETIKEQFDFIISRAVTSLAEQIRWTGKMISRVSKNCVPNGLLALKGGDLSNELDISFEYKLIKLDSYFQESFFETKKLVHVIL